jgi:hypothetical protein
MKKFLTILALGFLFGANSYAVENWEIKKVIDNKYIEISTEGLNVKGDKYKLLIKINGKCNTIEDGFTFYTTKNNSGVMLLPGKKIKVESMGMIFASEIKAVVPVLSGSHHMVWISNGAYELEGHTKFISEKEKNDVKLLFVFDDFEKKTGWEANEFFSTTTNSWSLTNVSKAVKEGKQMCLDN